jgi:hypothetical protein
MIMDNLRWKVSSMELSLSRSEVFKGGFADGSQAALDVDVDIDDTELETWFERDRAHVELREKGGGTTIVEWWDDAVQEMAEDGFLTMGRGERALHESAFKYAEQHKLFPTEGIIVEKALELAETRRKEEHYNAETSAWYEKIYASPELKKEYERGLLNGVKKGSKVRLKK